MRVMVRGEQSEGDGGGDSRVRVMGRESRVRVMGRGEQSEGDGGGER